MITSCDDDCTGIAGDIAIRAVRPDDKERIVRAFNALEPRSVYLRFFSHKKALGEEELRQVTECDGADEAVLVATDGSGDRENVGLGHYLGISAAADVAFVVEEDFQGRGIASALLRRLVDLARANGIAQFEADVLAENAPMLAVLRNSGLPMKTSRAQGVLHATLVLA